MKRVLRHRRKKNAPGLDMAPLLDMIFILLIFFVVNASFIRETSVPVERPSAQTAVEAENVRLVLAVDAAGRVFLEDVPVDPGVLRGRMQAFATENPGALVVVAADRDCPSGMLMRVLDICRLAGVPHLALAARRPE
ncbi:biopolymer transporter ExbD [Desulfobotulus sp.]|jgi:biopolymer transport protein ExbD|uniref:ExbD/TolR family protein n=1 Tax=Desulfobotulus sp. TaxID=1940337 RepID=UPI002A372495|nr:biopolymer transporter ExbD [Desulfobotulus sp.]MDY0163197.1 biopolymer transporter ExbD [Desulfobotulus sp.]